MSRLGEQVRNIRTSKGITQKQLAKMVGASEKFIDEVERGKRVLNDDLIKKISKALVRDISGLDAYDVKDGNDSKPEKSVKNNIRPQKQEVQEIWHDALDSVLKTIPIYEYDLSKVIGTKQLPIQSNKIEGHAKDKVFFLQIQDNEMIGFRMIKGDLAFAHYTHEIENNSICLVEYDGKKAIRQVKRLDGDKVLLVSNRGTLSAETFTAKSVKILARLDKLEIML